MSFCYFIIIPLGKRSGPLFEEIRGSFNEVCFVPSLVEIRKVVLEKKIFQLRLYVSLFRIYLPLEKGRALSFEQTWISFTLGCFVQRRFLCPRDGRLRRSGGILSCLTFCPSVLLSEAFRRYLYFWDCDLDLGDCPIFWKV